MAAQIDTLSPFGTYPAGGVDRLAWRLIDGGGFRATLRHRAGRLIGRMFPGPYDAEVDGLKFRLYPGENYDDRKILARARLPEQNEHALIGDLLRPGAIFVDIGANVGTYALFAARRGARVLAIEAAPATAEKLAFNIAANEAAGPAGRIHVAHTAVGEEPGMLTLWSSATNCGFATLAGEFADGQAGIWTAEEVPVRPLADVLIEAGIDRPDVMKIDVEGFEDRVLMPYLEATPRGQWPRAVLMETNCSAAWKRDPRETLTAHGFAVEGRTDDNVLLVDRESDAT
ncbi:FkbM family methyltransferase [Breoghania corrubedonensis]|uniref:FkbM family methyltransferase n=1 Tax=Breoghania corrubedonensis TaxID=665038 RepID=A0A2T5VGU8_9HYPH|nr:FkbM family methyltransferase [Breoghania corrubedonensis]PTW62969.1 FkbM family methyltransferase [Breoghania corrubedonensis]